MTVENFIHEVSEELKQEEMKALWGKYCVYALIVAFVLIILTGIYELYSVSHNKKMEKIADSFIESIASGSNSEQSLKNLHKIAQSGNKSYALLANLRMAGIYAQKNMNKEAVAELDKVIAKTTSNDLLRMVASIRKGYILVDSSDADTIKQVLQPCLDPGNSFHVLAYEILGLSYWKQGDIGNSRTYFKKILHDSPNGSYVSSRARLMLSVLSEASFSS